MAEDTANPEEGRADGAPNEGGGKKSKKKMLIFIVTGLVLVLGAGGGAFFFMSGGGGEQKEMAAKSNAEGNAEAPVEGEHAEGEHAEGGEQAAAPTEGAKPTAAAAAGQATDGVGFGETYTMKTFHLNLGNPLENHYIRVDVALEFRGGEMQKAEIERRLPQLRDAIVGVISRQTRDMILDPDGKAQLRREMLIRINRYMNKPIEAVYITDILIE